MNRTHAPVAIAVWLVTTMGKETKNSAPVLIIDQSVIMYANQNGIELPEFIENVGNLDIGNSNAGGAISAPLVCDNGISLPNSF